MNNWYDDGTPFDTINICPLSRYQNAAAIATGETSYEYTHTTGKDTVIQCITDTKTYTWNVFTVTDPEQTKKNDKVGRRN